MFCYLAAVSLEAERIQTLANDLERHFGVAPPVAVVLGSGWAEGGLARLGNMQSVAVSELPGIPRPQVEGHDVAWHLGEMGGRRTLLCGGRVHLYEGYSPAELVRGVRGLAAWGVSHLVLLNAAGSVSADRPVGSFMPIADHINGGFPLPLSADQSVEGKPVFLDLVNLYDVDWRSRLMKLRPDLVAGVYGGQSGPCYETPAEVNLWRILGADALGMSTIPEAVAGKAVGMRILGISMITNLAAGVCGSEPSHVEVLETAKACASLAGDILVSAVATID